MIRHDIGSRRGMIVGVAFLALAACGQDVIPTEPAILQRPTAVTFACVGDMITNPGDENPNVIVTAQPVSTCNAFAAGTPPAGQEPLLGSANVPSMRAFVTQSAQGTMALLLPGLANVILDADDFTPGKNSIPIGTLPVDAIADESGCFIVSANAGTCDLSTLDVNSAASTQQGPVISRIAVRNAMGDVIDAKPAAIAVSPQSTDAGVVCPATPTGIAYIAYPECNLVAAVDLATGTVEGGLKFLADGQVAVVDGNVSCSSQCGGGMVETDAGPADAAPDAAPPVDAALVDAAPVDAGPTPPVPPMPQAEGAPRPVTLSLDPVSGQLLIGADNSNSIAIATLDSNLPTAARTVVLEGAIGVTKLKATEIITMGGSSGEPGGTAGDFQFIYAVASDRSIRVVDVEAGVECDTQVDPRFLRDETNIAFMACMPVGGADTPPRRPQARGPGIELPRQTAPLDVEFGTISRRSNVSPGPFDLTGTFGFVTSSDGFIFVINIDDDAYPDVENNADPESTFISLAISHQLRDFVTRDPLSAPGLNRDILRRTCSLPDGDEGVLPPRLRGGIGVDAFDSQINDAKNYELPGLRTVECLPRDENNEPGERLFLSELAFASPVDLREKSFPDLRATRNEQWSIAWQGSLSRDGVGSNIDGAPVRSGVIERNGATASMIDVSNSFCAVGVEPFDVVQLAGCDPSLGDSNCGLGEECFVHPEAPSSLVFGTCLPSDRTDILAVQCRDFLVASKTYSVTDTSAGAIGLRTRRRMLDTTPIDGCTSNEQCQEMADLDRLLQIADHPNAAELPDDETSWVCDDDPSRARTVPTCQMSCTETSDCEDGFSCETGFCVAGPLPPPECTGLLQRYQINGGEAFVVIGALSGYLHNRIVDEATGECIDNPDGNPLLTGRIPLRAPACTGDAIDDQGPNPCSTEILQGERFIEFAVVDGVCESTGEEFDSREAMVPAVRFTNPAMQFHMVDLETTGDSECRDDGLGTYPAYTAAHNGFQLTLDVTGGFSPMFITSNGRPPVLRIPATLTKAFDGQIWLLDRGDISGGIQGRVLIINTSDGEQAFGVSAFDRIDN